MPRTALLVGLQCQTATCLWACLARAEGRGPRGGPGGQQPQQRREHHALRSEVSSNLTREHLAQIKRIRFSTIQSEVHPLPDGCEKTGASSMSSDVSQPPSEEK